MAGTICRRIATVLSAFVLVLCAASCSFLPRQPYGEDPIDQVRTEVSAIRGLAWKTDIPFNSMNREALKNLLDEELNESWEEDDALLASELEVSPDDKPPHHPLTRLALWPLCVRPLDRVWEANLLGGMVLDGRFHADGHRLRLADSLLLHSESSPDRFALWAACGWIGGMADDSLGIGYVRLPFVLNWHGRAQLAQEDSRARCSLALGSVHYHREGAGKRLKLLWGLLLSAGWGDKEEGGTRVRVLGIPLVRGNPTDT